MNSQTDQAQEQEQPVTARERPARATSGIDPFQLVGMVIDAVRNECDCRPCKALRKIGDSLADGVLGLDQEASS